ncbi:hypothetical protein Rumeso_03195 [Rubellimicrobium mesophilum DSM 19309]|uniref:Transmembrane protein n=1 Tax=Rubellimicrobium mesophilum DSM 19309 TaxID=442562 RepID=A0A017HNC3_9RHOB|nr:hypothetical protein [Rubellimicrobium mesophilum]EYD75284.1 hypothetical protein Rumeso_03195 [Rubellimicrobium mesophilum DSM 19309]
MSDEHPAGGEEEFREEEASLVRITLGPVVWMAHFIVSYAATAVVCAKLSTDELVWLRMGIAAATLLALGTIAWLGRRSWRQWRHGNEDIWEDPAATSEDRHQFLGHAALLLAVISFIGVIYTALPALFAATCR